MQTQLLLVWLFCAHILTSCTETLSDQDWERLEHVYDSHVVDVAADWQEGVKKLVTLATSVADLRVRAIANLLLGVYSVNYSSTDRGLLCWLVAKRTYVTYVCLAACLLCQARVLTW